LSWSRPGARDIAAAERRAPSAQLPARAVLRAEAEVEAVREGSLGIA